MKQPLRVLLVHFASFDAALVLSQLHYSDDADSLIYQRVETITALRAALNENIWDIVIVDYTNLQLGAFLLLQLLKETGVNLPLIIISDEIGKEASVTPIFSSAYEKLALNIPGTIFQLLVRVDGSYSLLFISANCYEIYELEPEHIQQNPTILFDIVDRGDRLSFERSLSSSAETLQPCSWEGRITTHKGKVKWIKVNAQFQLQPNGDILWDGLAIDITESKQTQEALNESQTQLRQQRAQLEAVLQELHHTQMQLVEIEKMSSLGQLLAGVAHEINNPINFIDNNLNFASKYIQDILNLLNLYQFYYPNPVAEIETQAQEMELEFVTEDLPKILYSMKLGSDRICDLVMSLRNFSRLDQTTAQIVDIHQVIDSVVLILQHRFKPDGGKPGIEIIKEYTVLPNVKCYPGQLNQVFMNLIANAIDAIEESYNFSSLKNRLSVQIKSEESKPSKLRLRSRHKGTYAQLKEISNSLQSENLSLQVPKSTRFKKTLSPTIRISTRILEDNSHVVIRIADNGSGIPAEQQAQIFNAFFTTKPIGKGTGLGLSISYQIIVEKHGGKLWCFSKPGQGTEFIIEIPIDIISA
ncbi:MAG: PAS domain-containing protein [Cyanomargarita calcarea GSE-NOS-MK-12-04C]|uniref:histidine kinase n=1 Tax=Cyanomargarita calcarea GSE-NOS-MK-12-04C TaxID=2839659 RepID=A0A951QN81_9CYAN|nr:PAS domain-containing protein [Cyanomargarita calcarea GSE-NOS-MK-12-04C]